MSKNFEYFNNALNTQSLSTWRALENYVGFNSKVRVYNLPFGYFMNKVEGKFTATVIGHQLFFKFKGTIFEQDTTERPQQLPDIILNNLDEFIIKKDGHALKALKSERRIEKIPITIDVEINEYLILRNITIPPEWTLIEEYDLFNGSYSNSELGTQISTLSNLVSSQSAEIEKLKKNSGSDSSFKTDINESVNLVLTVKEKEGRVIVEFSVDKEDFEVKFDLTSSGNKQEVHVTHSNPFELGLSEKLHSSYNSWGLHLYREILDISNCRTKTINNYSQGKFILFKFEGFRIYLDSIDITDIGMTIDELDSSISSDIFKTLSNHQTFGIAAIKSSNNKENTCYLISKDTRIFESDTSSLDKLAQSKLSNSIIFAGTGKLSHISWFKLGNTIEKVSPLSSLSGIRSLLDRSYYESSLKTILDMPDNISQAGFLSFYKVFSDNLEEICKVKTINISAVDDIDLMNPVIVNQDELKSYGSNFDKKGHPYRISLNADNLLLLFVFRTNLSEWLITHAYDNEFNNTNYNKLPGRITGRDNYSRDDKTFLLNSDNYAYRYNTYINSLVTDGYAYLNSVGLETDNIIKCYIGDTVEDLKESGSIEVYSLEPFKYKNAKLKSIFDSFSNINTIISSLVDTQTGENLPVQDEGYIKLQNARMCCHQTVSWDSERSIPKVTKVEFITLSEMVKIFISKSTEYLKTHEPALDDYVNALQKVSEYSNRINGEYGINEAIHSISENLEWTKRFRTIYNKLKEINSKDISKFKSEFESSEDKTNVIRKIADYLFTGIEDKITTGSMPDDFRASSVFIPSNSDGYTAISNLYINDRLEIKRLREGDYFYYNSFEDLKTGMLNYSISDFWGGSSIDSLLSGIKEDNIDKIERALNAALKEARRYKDLRLYEKYDNNSLRNYSRWGVRL